MCYLLAVPNEAPQNVTTLIFGDSIKVTWTQPALRRLFGKTTGYKVVYHSVTANQGTVILCVKVHSSQPQSQ